MRTTDVTALLGRATNRLLFRPWFDRVTLRWVTGVYFPLSRGWAAADAADGDRDAFAAALGWRRSDLPGAAVDRLLAAVREGRDAHRGTRAAWEAAFLAPDPPATARLAEAEAAREQAAQTWMAARMQAVPIHLRRRFPALANRIVGRETVDQRHGHRLADPAARFPAPDAAGMRRTHTLATADGDLSWLSWPSPDIGDTAWARVLTPRDAGDPPTLIDLHGIGMELEMWRAQRDPVTALAPEAGIRVVRPEGPWHGTRQRPGYYGGEPALAFAPAGFLDLLHGWVREVAQLIAWARATSGGPVAVGGLSLGALTAQIVATAAAWWPEHLRPDVLMLTATSGDMVEVGFEGALARRLGLIARLQDAGWTHDRLTPLRPLMEPQGPPVMDPSRVVMLLGDADTVTPYAGGVDLARQWRVPAANVFVRHRGHFSLPLGLYTDPAPLDRLTEVLRGAA